jgi:hypothetical protein
VLQALMMKKKKKRRRRRNITFVSEMFVYA